jgi:hypothetical protein
LKHFTIGDSVSQGFMSGAAARTDLSYSTLIAGSMGLGDEYRFPRWGADGLPLNLEKVCRALVENHGSNIWGPEWLTENLILWLGANNALGTILGLKIRYTPDDSDNRPHELTHEER